MNPIAGAIVLATSILVLGGLVGLLFIIDARRDQTQLEKLKLDFDLIAVRVSHVQTNANEDRKVLEAHQKTLDLLVGSARHPPPG